jgi:hypothetical protein
MCKPLFKNVHATQKEAIDSCIIFWNNSSDFMEEIKIQLFLPIYEATPATAKIVEVENENKSSKQAYKV